MNAYVLESCKHECLRQDLSFFTRVVAWGERGSEEELDVLCRIKFVNLHSRLLEDLATTFRSLNTSHFHSKGHRRPVHVSAS